MDSSYYELYRINQIRQENEAAEDARENTGIEMPYTGMEEPKEKKTGWLDVALEFVGLVFDVLGNFL